MKQALVASLEAIDFQRNSTLIKEMGMQFDTCLRDPSKDTFNKCSEALSAIAFKHTKMKFRFHFVRLGGPNAFVIPPQADIANPMRPDEIATKVQRLGRMPTEQELFKGTVDLKTGQVGGIYSEIPIDIFTAVEFFTDRNMGNITGDHIAAISAHEMGHGFTYLRYLGQMVLSNCAVAEIIKKQHEGADDKVVQEVVKVVEQRTGWRLRDLGEINRSTDPLVVQQVIMAGMVDSIRSELGTKFYDRRAFEFSADQFVARHGGAQLIVEALDIMYKSYPAYFKEYRGRMANIMSSLVGYGRLVLGSLMVAGGIMMVQPLFFIFGLFMVLMSLFGGGDDGIYDPIPKRYEAMRRELIASSKDQNLSIAQRKEIIDQITAIDSILEEVAKNSKGYFAPDVAIEFLKGIFNGRPAEQKFQRMLENLVNNRLFELSNQLQAKSV
ncbi:hypothetical protein PA10_00192 [Pseudomonas phage pPa_SNUABM_DT01]|nr:hypothetical protein PA10_00192 [Pseudomonas phage pPa_SNUABM_DT01]